MLLTLHRNHISERNFLSFKYNSVNKYRKIPDISGGNIVSIEAIITGEPRSAPEGTWVIGAGIETPCKYLIYADKILKSKIRTMLRKASV